MHALWLPTVLPIVATVAISLGCRSKPSRSEKTAELPTAPQACEGKPCIEVPTGIKGLAFGMEPSQVRAALGAPESWTEPAEPHRVHSSDPDAQFAAMLKPGSRGGQIVPGIATVVNTTLGGAKARCRLDFGPSRQLIGIACTVTAVDVPDINDFFDTVAQKLVTRHGPPSSRAPTSKRSEFAVTAPRLHEWRSDEATLRLSIDSGSMIVRGPQALLENHTAEHDATLRAAQLAANNAVTRAAQRKAAVEEAARRERQREFEQQQEQLDDDLAGAAEKNRLESN